ncbi:MAG TPA: hypothetical protein VGA44_07220 [Steroidobacteraceae bacterium]
MAVLAASVAGLAAGSARAQEPSTPAAPAPPPPAVAAPDAGPPPPEVAAPIARPDASPPPGTVPAIWIEKELSFTYFGITSFYSCDSLRDKVKWIMKQLGAMEGYTVRTRSCFNSGGPERSPRIVIEAAVPQRVTPELLAELSKDQSERDLIARVRGEHSVIGNPEAQFAARTRRVTFDDRNLRGRIEAGDCDLMEQLRDKVFVPLGVNVVEDKISCAPHQVSRGSVKIELEVLEPWTPEPEPEPTADPAAAP